MWCLQCQQHYKTVKLKRRKLDKCFKETLIRIYRQISFFFFFKLFLRLDYLVEMYQKRDKKFQYF